jgi:hypothetical protein
MFACGALQDVYVTIISVANCFGRLLAGFGSDALSAYVSRPMFFVVRFAMPPGSSSIECHYVLPTPYVFMCSRAYACAQPPGLRSLGTRASSHTSPHVACVLRLRLRQCFSRTLLVHATCRKDRIFRVTLHACADLPCGTIAWHACPDWRKLGAAVRWLRVRWYVHLCLF